MALRRHGDEHTNGRAVSNRMWKQRKRRRTRRNPFPFGVLRSMGESLHRVRSSATKEREYATKVKLVTNIVLREPTSALYQGTRREEYKSVFKSFFFFWKIYRRICGMDSDIDLKNWYQNSVLYSKVIHQMVVWSTDSFRSYSGPQTDRRTIGNKCFFLVFFGIFFFSKLCMWWES